MVWNYSELNTDSIFKFLLLKVFMKARHILILKLFYLSLVFFIGACAVFKEERNYSKDGLTIMFRSLNHLDDVSNLTFKYPIIVSEKNIRNHLLSLLHRDIIKPRGLKPVFSKATVAKIAPLFKTVMKKVKPGKYLHFEYQDSKGITEGQVFVTAKKIHWRLFRINGVAYSNDPLRLIKPTWKLIRIPGQNYQTLKTGGFKKTIQNRIIANINLPFPKYRDRSRSSKNPLAQK